MSWHYLYIEDPKTSFVESGKFIDAMHAFFIVSGQKDDAIYAKQDFQTGGTHYFFTPQAQPVAITFGAKPCSKPSRDGLSLLVGDQTLVDRLYP